MAKHLILGLVSGYWAQIRAANFFFKNLASSVTRYHGQLSSCTISEKTNDGRRDRHSDGQTDENDFIGRCLTDVERPILKTKFIKYHRLISPFNIFFSSIDPWLF